jgi:hypothetical protein
MYKRLAAISGTVAILAATLLASGSDAAARGGGRLSVASDTGDGPSRYAHSSQVSPRAVRHAQRTDFGITEYSSSSAKSSVPKR